MIKTSLWKKSPALFMALALAVTPIGGVTAGAEEPEAESDYSTSHESAFRIDILHHADFHGIIDSFISASDPGAARFAAFSELWRSQNSNPNNVVMVAAGDNYHGHPISNHLLGAPMVWLYDYLGVNYSALGNHEFSFGSVDQAQHFGENITFLAADIFYAGTNNRPAWVQPYTIIESDCGEGIIAMIGLMTNGMPHLISSAIMAPFELRTPTLRNAAGNTNPANIVAIEELIAHLRDYYSASAVVALTHMGTGGGHGAEARDLAELVNGLDAIIAGHSHQRNNFYGEEAVNDTIIAEAGWHGRSIGRLSFHFDENGDLVNITNVLSPANAMLPANFDITEQPANVQAVYNEVSARMAQFEVQAGPYLNQVFGTRGIYGVEPGTTDNVEQREHRNMWVTKLVEDYVANNFNDNTWGINLNNDWVFVSNYGGWRNMGPWEWEPNTPVTMLDMIATMPFNNAILLFEMQGRDLITLLDMEASDNTDLSPPNFGLNGGQSAVVSGAFRGDRIADFIPPNGGDPRPRHAWYFSNSGNRISDDATVYRIIGSNFIWGGGAMGGDRFPFPGNSHGDALGMTFISQPVALLGNGMTVPWPDVPTDSSLWEEFGLRLLRDAMIGTLEWRSNNPSQYSAWVEITIEGEGNAEVTSPWSPHGYRGINIHGTRVTVTATPNAGYAFYGWYEGNVQLSTNEIFTFTMGSSGNNLIARFDGFDNGTDSVTTVQQPATTPTDHVTSINVDNQTLEQLPDVLRISVTGVDVPNGQHTIVVYGLPAGIEVPYYVDTVDYEFVVNLVLSKIIVDGEFVLTLTIPEAVFEGTYIMYIVIYDENGNAIFTTNDFVLQIGAIQWPEPPPSVVPFFLSDQPAGYQTTIRLTIGELVYTVNGTAIQGEPAPFIDPVYNRAMVPKRMIAEALGAQVDWDSTTRVITITYGTQVYTMQADTSLPDGMGIPIIINDRTFVPITYVAQLWRANVTWDAANMAVYIQR
ncbi:MAG: stalk domain-containing protein [Defluviitaleaceae bacterium]|nr:stalk domain-containing protein [Defluviitaleaceae bacterium]